MFHRAIIVSLKRWNKIVAV